VTGVDIQSDNYRSSLRNKLIAEAFYLAGNIEKYGSGFIRIRKALRDYSEIEFEIKEFAGGVMATFAQRKGLYVGVNELLAYVESHPGQRAGEMAVAFKLTHPTNHKTLALATQRKGIDRVSRGAQNRGLLPDMTMMKPKTVGRYLV